MDLVYRLKALLKYLSEAKTNLYLHSPFLFEFSEKILHDKKNYSEYIRIKKLISEISNSDLSFATDKKTTRKIKSELKSSAVNNKYGKLIFRISRYYNCKNIIDLGTNLGISAARLALSNAEVNILTFEKNESLISLAEKFHQQSGIQNIKYIPGNIDGTLHQNLTEQQPIDFVLMDANHTYRSTIDYFKIIAPHLHAKSIVVVDDIHWSPEMNKAWKEITQHPSVTLSIDLYRMGILFFNADLTKENFTLFF